MATVNDDTDDGAAVDPSDRWGNERYVRLLTRETADRAAWCWQARALMPWLVCKADGAGLLETSKGARGIAAITMLPLEVVGPGLDELIADGFVVVVDGGYLVRNYVAVQTAAMSASQRQARLRDNRRAAAALASRLVTDGHAVSRAETIVTEDVTPSRSDPSRSDPNQAKGEGECEREALPRPAPGGALPRSRKPKPSADPTPEERATCETVLAKLSARNGVAYRGSPEHLRLITARLRSGCTEADLRKVIHYAASARDDGGLGWAEDESMRAWLRPETLFGPKTIAKYLDPAVAWCDGGTPKPRPETPTRADHDPPSEIVLKLFGGRP